ncbi:MAG TPA: V-type ATP synthase subunit F [Spirochaetales bacterium]|nr:V-type ATP synthase subunit F [Spirochaetales bacterium]MBP7262743.1 V-type ATP synthase subunit F [Spirochaetia bacterium]HPE36831.1 V-type ATP synthase subunit F [Spirochaetales bacterium]
MRYFVIGDEDAVLGFGMVGVDGRTAHDADEAGAAFSDVLAMQDVGIVIMTEPVASMIRETVDRYLFSARFPLVVEIPGRKGRMPGRPGVRELANAAIGVKL